MMKKALLVCLLIVAALSASYAQARTTPVEVTNTPSVTVTGIPTVKIDPTTNTIKIDSTTNTVKSAQSGVWNVGITGTPTVSVSGTPAVTLSGVDNTVKAPTQANKIQLWTTNQSISAGATLTTSVISCTGYKEIRVTLGSSPSAAETTKVYPYFSGFGVWIHLGYLTIAENSPGVVAGATFHPNSGRLTFTIPVMSDLFLLDIRNDGTGPITMYAQSSWVYLVN